MSTPMKAIVTDYVSDLYNQMRDQVGINRKHMTRNELIQVLAWLPTESMKVTMRNLCKLKICNFTLEQIATFDHSQLTQIFADILPHTESLLYQCNDHYDGNENYWTASEPEEFYEY